MAESLSSEDRELLRERVRGRLEATDRTQRQVEEELGWSSGTLTRVFGGRKQLDAEMLGQLAERLGIPAASLVEGTALSAEAPEPATPARAAEPAAPEAEPEPAAAAPEPEAAEAAAPEPEAAEPEPAAAAPAATTPAPAATAPAEAETVTRPAANPERAAADEATTRVDRPAVPEAAPIPENGAGAPEAGPTDGPGGVRGWLRSMVKRVFGSRQD
jgi:transcriptional regulator with XRE-family HTH domain